MKTLRSWVTVYKAPYGSFRRDMCWKGGNRLKYLDKHAMKCGNFLSQLSPYTVHRNHFFCDMRSIMPANFGDTRLGRKVRPTWISEQATAGRRFYFSKIFLTLKYLAILR